MVRCLLSDASELLGGWTDTDRERTLRYFDGRCAYTGVSYDPATFVWDHLIPHNQDACGLHVYGNLVPATRAANSAKAAKDFRVFPRQAHECLGDLTTEERETRIRRLEDFRLNTGYAEMAAAIKDLPALCAEQFLERFLAAGVAYIEEHYADGRVKVRQWQVESLTAKSNLVANIRSRPEYRQGNWQGAGLAKLVMHLEPPGLRVKAATDGTSV